MTGGFLTVHKAEEPPVYYDYDPNYDYTNHDSGNPDLGNVAAVEKTPSLETTPASPNTRDRRRRQAYVGLNDDLFAGVQTNRSWMYDGLNWKEMKQMKIARDRPACSLVILPNGKVK